MSLSVKILLPVFSLKSTIYLCGFMCTSDPQEIVIYITKYSTNPDFRETSDKSCVIHGYYSSQSFENQKFGKETKNILVLNHQNQILIQDLLINGKQILLDNCIIMLYDYDRMKNSETMYSSSKYFTKLRGFLNSEEDESLEYIPLLKNKYWFISSSVLIQHFISYINLINWLYCTLWKQKKISIKPGNLMLAIIIDIILGYITLQLITEDKNKLSSILIGILEKLVDSLYSLLKWLMGAPAGLKLNNAFNKMLGKYFSYHIQLWWLFLDVTGEKLDIILHVFHYVGYLGFSFQAAIISDMFCVATFHSYCIYVYAARLFNIQVSGLIALLRFFVGRKYNPLRGRIDSCEYSNQELFVGTVAFTILLLLMPTTTMYYIVFTLFRLLSLGVQYILSKLIYWTQTIPLYVVALWIARSPKVTGDVYLEVVNNESSKPLIIKVNLYTKSISELVNKLTPPVDVSKYFDWAQLLSNIFVGKFVNFVNR